MLLLLFILGSKKIRIDLLNIKLSIMAKKSPNESPNEFFTQAAWAAMWNPKSDYYLPNVIKNGIAKEGVKVDPLGNLTMDNVPSSGSFQLMK